MTTIDKPKINYFTRTNLIWLSIELAVIWVLLSPPVAKSWYESLIFQPTASEYHDVKSVDGVDKQQKNFTTSTGSNLSAWYFEKPGANRVILVNHGNAGTISDRCYLIEELLKCGASVFIYDFAGYGTSTGKPSIPEICADGDAAYDYLVKELHVPAGHIVIFGESLGTGVACHVASHQECKSLILESPFLSMIRLGKQRFFWLNLYPTDWLNVIPDLNNGEMVAHLTKPILLIHGAKDATVPCSDPIELSKLAKNPTLVVIPGRGHNDLYYPPTELYRDAVSRFLRAE